MPSQNRPRSHTQAAFTLIELLMTMALLALVTSIAYPSYASQVNKSRTAQAIAEIVQLEMDLERYITQNGALPGTLEAASMQRLDPWGNAYGYLPMEGAKVGQVRKDKSLHPLNTDYDLYSKGPDGKSVSPLTAKSSRDDIVRANNGAFVGVAADY